MKGSLHSMLMSDEWNQVNIIRIYAKLILSMPQRKTNTRVFLRHQFIQTNKPDEKAQLKN